MQYQGFRLKCEFTLTEGVGLLILWVLLCIVTLGLALFVLPYYFLKAPINRTALLDPSGVRVGRLSVDVGLADILGHALLWLVLTLLTLGLAYLVYWPSVIKRLLNGVVIVRD